jgi:hypothetical protein
VGKKHVRRSWRGRGKGGDVYSIPELIASRPLIMISEVQPRSGNDDDRGKNKRRDRRDWGIADDISLDAAVDRSDGFCHACFL